MNWQGLKMSCNRNVEIKTCLGCKEDKPLSYYYKQSGQAGYHPRCKVCRREYTDKWKKNNANRMLQLNAKYRVNNREARRQSYKKWQRKRTAEDPCYVLKKNLRNRLRAALSGVIKSAKIMQLLGCSIEELKARLEKQFLPGMAWENYGEWHVDHIRPCASFDLRQPDQQEQCFHFSNLQPMWALQNILKSDSIS